MSNVLVWPWPLRLIHWSLAVCVMVAWSTPNTYDALHRVAGYTILALVGLRLVLGIVGPSHVRFNYMVRTAADVVRYIKHRRVDTSGPTRLGLNPVGAMMALTLLSLLVISGVTGWMQVTEPFFGVAWVQDTHTYTSYALAGLVPLHVLGVFVTSMRQGENLVRAMITGRRRRHEGL